MCLTECRSVVARVLRRMAMRSRFSGNLQHCHALPLSLSLVFTQCPVGAHDTSHRGHFLLIVNRVCKLSNFRSFTQMEESKVNTHSSHLTILSFCKSKNKHLVLSASPVTLTVGHRPYSNLMAKWSRRENKWCANALISMFTVHLHHLRMSVTVESSEVHRQLCQRWTNSSCLSDRQFSQQ